ncbi:MAG TPA: proteasome accessory factor PafA2 family protein, partial [Methylomirabilota bacterium]|nr:proteasome accessory factor PafA2 family protein [Methylomirabilota bacterium]
RHFRRLHLIHGDSNVLPASLYLKTGTTRLVLDLLEADEMPAIALADAVTTLRSLSRCLRPPWRVTMSDGRPADALELLGAYHERAAKLFRGRDAETDDVLDGWWHALEALDRNPASLVGTVDWVTKEHLLSEFCRSEGIGWDHPWLESQDLEYHHIDPTRSLGLPFADGHGICSREAIRTARFDPPKNSRAHARSRMMREIKDKDLPYALDWEAVEVVNQKRTRMLNPFQP